MKKKAKTIDGLHWPFDTKWRYLHMFLCKIPTLLRGVTFQACKSSTVPQQHHTLESSTVWTFSLVVRCRTHRKKKKNGAKTLPDGAAHTYMAYIREYPRPLSSRVWEQLVQPVKIKWCKMWRKTYISVLWIWHAEQSSLKFDWANYNIGPISIFKPRSSPELFVSFGSVVMENKRFSSRARYIKVEGLWGREFLKAWPSRFYLAINSFHYKDLNSIQMALCTTVPRCAKIPVTCRQ